VLVVIAASFALGNAMTVTGGAEWVAGGLLGLFGPLTPWPLPRSSIDKKRIFINELKESRTMMTAATTTRCSYKGVIEARILAVAGA